MRDIEAYRIPKHLDDPDRFLLWTLDEAIIIMGCFFAGIYLTLFIEGLIAGFALWIVYRRVKRGMSPHDLFAAMYWSFPHWASRHIPWLKGFPPSSHRFYMG